MSNESTTVTINPTDNGWQYATGEIPISMTNDFLFCTMLEKNNAVLKSLICALLHLPPEELQTAEIRNPISSGHTKEDKTIILDVKVLLNQNTILNLELQVMNEHNWPERSIYYLAAASIISNTAITMSTSNQLYISVFLASHFFRRIRNSMPHTT